MDGLDRPHPGCQQAASSGGEYHGKFVSGPFALRGGSCATLRGHSPASYRDFSCQHQCWQFNGPRLVFGR